jgi:AraC-like DNA-binding protein
MTLEPHGTSHTAPLPRGVRRALDAMRANMGRDWKVVDLAAVACVSGRTLQRQFRTFLDKTPVAVLRDVRFKCARRELLQGAPGVKVMDVALRCGFAHCGRFSVEYGRRYQETPSETLKRQALFADAPASMPSFLVSGRARPTVLLGPIEAGPENAAIARSIADELATALTRAGVFVTSRSVSGRYHLTGIMREQDRQTLLIFRLVEIESGRPLSVCRCDGAPGAP